MHIKIPKKSPALQTAIQDKDKRTTPLFLNAQRNEKQTAFFNLTHNTNIKSKHTFLNRHAHTNTKDKAHFSHPPKRRKTKNGALRPPTENTPFSNCLKRTNARKINPSFKPPRQRANQSIPLFQTASHREGSTKNSCS